MAVWSGDLPSPLMAIFFIVTQLLLGFLARTLKLSQVIALWMRTGGTHSECWCDPWGQSQGVWSRRVQTSFCTNIVMLHIKLKIMKNRLQWCKNFALGACLRVTRGQKVGFLVLLMTDSSVIPYWHTRFQVAYDFHYLWSMCPHINVVQPIFSFACNFTQIMFT